MAMKNKKKFSKRLAYLLLSAMLLAEAGPVNAAEWSAEGGMSGRTEGNRTEENRTEENDIPEAEEGSEQTDAGSVSGAVPVKSRRDGLLIKEDVEYVLGRPMTEKEEEEQRQLMEKYVSMLTQLEPDKAVQRVLNDSEDMVQAASLPSAYDSRNRGWITSVKNQSPYGSCWSFSSINLAETSLVKKGLKPLSGADLSEYHLAYYTYRSVTDPLGGTSGDKNYKASVNAILNDGGNYSRAGNTLLSWMGAVEESRVPYSMALSELPQTQEKAYGQNTALLTNTREINIQDISQLKQAIMDYGSAGIMYFATTDSAYYNFSTAAQYCNNGSLGVNHAVSVVGWDDNYSVNNFSTKPSGSGAWLVKNSWGTGYGNQGYFWLSYKDATINDTAFVFDMVNAGTYDNNYQYDGSGANASVGLTGSFTAANVFTAHAREGRKELLKAVSFAARSTNANYSIQIYKDLTNMANPESGTAMLSTPLQGRVTFEGTYTVELDTPIELWYDDTFAVVVTLSKSGGDALIGLEYNGGNSTASAAPGQSYYKGSSWIDYGSRVNANFRIKAYTSNVNVEGLDIRIKGEKRIENVGDSRQFQAIVYPENAPNRTVTWSTSDANIVDVNSSGLVTAMGIGTATITATANGDRSRSVSMKVEVPSNQHNRVRSFVNRMYSVALERKPDAKGASYWTNELLAGSKDGAAVAKGFILSSEMERRKLNNGQYVDMLYKTLFNRSSDASGKAYWVNLLENGVSRAYVFRGFCHSKEFTSICESYGITRGSVQLTENRDQKHNVTMYVFRCYERTLGRKPDTKGLNYWTGEILTKRRTPEDVAGNFVFSKEFEGKKLSNEEYVKVLYRMFFDREADANGLKFWVNELKAGKRNRYKVFTGFAHSAEFKEVLKSFGL